MLNQLQDRHSTATFSNSLHNHKSMELWGRSRETESTWIKKIHGFLLRNPITVFKLVPVIESNN